MVGGKWSKLAQDDLSTLEWNDPRALDATNAAPLILHMIAKRIDLHGWMPLMAIPSGHGTCNQENVMIWAEAALKAGYSCPQTRVLGVGYDGHGSFRRLDALLLGRIPLPAGDSWVAGAG